MRLQGVLALIFFAATGYVHAQDIPDVETLVFRVDYLSLHPEVYYPAEHPYQGTFAPTGHRPAAGLYYDFEEPSDFGHIEIFSGLTTQRLLQAGVVWAGTGSFEFPSVAQGSTDFGEPGPPVVADTVAVVLTAGEGSAAEGIAAWEAVAGTEPVRDLAARGRVEVVVFEHFYTVGAPDPSTAEWFVVVYARPVVRDLAVKSIGWPGSLVTADHPFTPEVTLHNFSGAADSGRLVMETDGSPIHEEMLTLEAGETMEVTLPPLALDGDAALTFHLTPTGDPVDVQPGNNAQTQPIETTSFPVFRRFMSSDYDGVSLSGIPLDYDGDGDYDILTPYEGLDPFHAGLWAQQDDGSFEEVTAAAGLDLRPFPNNAVAADFTGDGILDLFVAYRFYAPALLRGDGETFEDVTMEAGLDGVTGHEGAEPADLDGDGDLDLVVLADGPEPILLNDGSGHFTQSALLDDPAETVDVAAADLDGDGDLDLALANRDGSSRVFANDGASGFTRVTGPWPSSTSYAVLAFDYEDDGDLDLLFAQTGGSLFVRNEGDLQFVPATVPALAVPSRAADAADFDGDGWTDIVFGGFGESGTVLLTQSAEGFTNRSELLVGASPVSFAPYARFLDFDADGDLDVFLRNPYFENQGAPGPDTAGESEPAQEQRRLMLYPNPSADQATAVFHLRREEHVTLRLFDVLGREVTTLADVRQPAGRVEVPFPLESLPSGVYFVRLEAGEDIETRPITVLR